MQQSQAFIKPGQIQEFQMGGGGGEEYLHHKREVQIVLWLGPCRADLQALGALGCYM